MAVLKQAWRVQARPCKKPPRHSSVYISGISAISLSQYFILFQPIIEAPQQQDSALRHHSNSVHEEFPHHRFQIVKALFVTGFFDRDFYQ
jgi:hypothetical protein